MELINTIDSRAEPQGQGVEGPGKRGIGMQGQPGHPSPAGAYRRTGGRAGPSGREGWIEWEAKSLQLDRNGRRAGGGDSM